MGIGSPTRSTKPRSTIARAVRLGLVSSGFWDGTPTSGRRLPSQSVRTDRRLTGGRPGRAATRFIVPIDRPSASLTRLLLAVSASATAGLPSPP